MDDFWTNINIDIPHLKEDLHQEFNKERVDKGVYAQTQFEGEHILADQEHGHARKTHFQEDVVHLQTSQQTYVFILFQAFQPGDI